ncbi:hypothetical protein K435DRAFT_972643 [Dendrothele bispora CBS 962.96]|uniref:Uncharacterized protein n=1 Tax=Dendrothele bispora (strain CBS 962.96) TaxID=1314807 RepID=A0A4V4HBU0_DENBC|nr:hypothetical protein K435DRAFT_972643 [Dendrothele bispora CBS 962.96]
MSQVTVLQTSSSPIRDDIHEILSSFYLIDSTSESEDSEEPSSPYEEFVRDPFSHECEEEDGDLYDLYSYDYNSSSSNSSPDTSDSDSSQSSLSLQRYPSRGRPLRRRVYSCRTEDEAMALMSQIPELSNNTYRSMIVEANSSCKRHQVTSGSERPTVRGVRWEDEIFPESGDAGEHVSDTKRSSNLKI